MGVQRSLVPLDFARVAPASSTPSQGKYSDVGSEGLRKITTIAKRILRLFLAGSNSSIVEASYGQEARTTSIVHVFRRKFTVFSRLLSLNITPKTTYSAGSKSKARERNGSGTRNLD